MSVQISSQSEIPLALKLLKDELESVGKMACYEECWGVHFLEVGVDIECAETKTKIHSKVCIYLSDDGSSYEICDLRGLLITTVELVDPLCFEKIFKFLRLED